MGASKGNQNALGNNGGRPPIHTDPKEVDTLIQDYFEWIDGDWEDTGDVDDDNKPIMKCTRRSEPPTVTGLALHIGFADKSSLYDYKKKDEFSHSIKRAISRIEKHHEIKIAQGDKCTGNIFALKNFGWKDKVEQEITSKQEIIWHEEKTYEANPEANTGT